MPASSPRSPPNAVLLHREGASAATLDELRAAIRGNERAEIAFLLVASAEWTKRYKFLALAFCRRTWCHHLVLDFLAVRLRLNFANQPISGIGAGLLLSLTNLAMLLRVETIWGEATATSAPFYEKVLQIRPVKDLFIIRRKAMHGIQRYHTEKQQRALAKSMN